MAGQHGAEAGGGQQLGSRTGDPRRREGVERVVEQCHFAPRCERPRRLPPVPVDEAAAREARQRATPIDAERLLQQQAHTGRRECRIDPGSRQPC